ncbi:sensor histidine kinase [Gallaecimonas sp. GXIMD4217]|uniref:sensor histidine kinase n=1 Tax=Gallaecimonas sp. GXIMD4217 TaxID=3131927 RepID=UPI00311AE17F
MEQHEVMSRLHQLALEQDRLTRQLMAGEQRFRGLARSVWRVQEEERKRLARELHDGLGQTLTALKHRLAALAPSDASRDALALAEQALADTRNLARLLRPAILDDLGLGPALNWLCRLTEQRTGWQVPLQLSGLDQRLAPELETLLFRVAQEALANAQKHAKASVVDISLLRTGQRLLLSVADNGAGFELDSALAAQGDGFGLRSMQDRVELFGGELVINTSPGSGTEIRVHLDI